MGVTILESILIIYLSKINTIDVVTITFIFNNNITHAHNMEHGGWRDHAEFADYIN